MTDAYRGVRQAFDAAARDYDRLRRELIPCFDDFYGTVGRMMPFAPDVEADVLDLGAGTGLLSAILREQFPKARFTLVDISEEMLAKAGERFAGEQVTIIAADYSREGVAGEYDAVVSALSIHHLGNEDKISLFHRINQSLKAGGVFINADEVQAPTPALDEIYWKEWVREVTARGVDAAEIMGASDRMQHDIPAQLDAQLAWLTDAGFDEVDCYYKYLAFAVYGGRKPA